MPAAAGGMAAQRAAAWPPPFGPYFACHSEKRKETAGSAIGAACFFFPFSEWRTKKSPKGSGYAAALWAAIPPAAAGTAQDAAEAARRQAFEKWMQGEAMTPQETRLVNELWNTDPAKASEYWAAGQFLNTDIPASSALDGGNFNDTIKAETTAPSPEGSPFDNLQDGIGWEAPSETATRANIAAFENGEKTFNDVVDDYAILYAEKVNSNRTWRWKER